MRLSELNIKIDIIGAVVTPGPFPGEEEKVIAGNIWAKRIQRVGKEAFELYGTINTVPVNFIIRSRNDITEDMKVKCNGTTYNIIGYQALKDDESFLLLATMKNE